jgi:ParB family chromosome partitioning protein
LDIKTLKIEQIVPNNYNPNIVGEDILAKLRAEIAQKGLCEPIIVRQAGDAYTIVDGEHRWRICRDLGWQEIPCIVQDYDDKEAKIKTLQLNYMRGQAVPVRLASLIHDLNKEISLEELARRLPYEEGHLMDSLELLKLPEDFGMAVERQALEDAEEMPMVVSFVLSRKQAEVLDEAIETAAESLPEGTKNRKTVALERICADFIERQVLKDEPELESLSNKTA